MKRNFAVLIVLILAASGLAGCATVNGTSSKNTDPTISGYISVGGVKKF